MPVIRPAAFDDSEVSRSRRHDIEIGRYFDDSVYVVGLPERDADNDVLDDGARAIDLIRAQANVAWVTGMGPWRCPTARRAAKR